MIALSLSAIGLVAPAHAQAPAPAPPAAPQGAEAPAAAPVEARPAAAGEHAPPAPAHGAASAASQPSDPHAARPAPGEAAAGAHAAEESHGESPWALVARIVNFALLAGGLAYVLKGPLGLHLQRRRQQIDGDLETARATAAKAAAQIADIDRRLAQLPADLEAARERGAEEIAGEEAAIRQRAEFERERLLAQMRREIELEVRLAKRQLLDHTADLAVQLATDQVSRKITDDDRRRLLDRYVSRLKEFHG